MIFRSRQTAAVILLLFILGGCSARTPFSRSATNVTPENRYNAFRQEYGICNATGLRAKASLYYTSKGSGHRTTMTLWGEYKTPLRLDVRAGIGTYVAYIREDKNGLTAFYPDQETAYSHSSPIRAVHLLGLPFPFSLKDLAGLICGCYPNLIPKSYDNAVPVADNGSLRFTFDNGPVSSITLTEKGTPTEISGRGEIPWRMELSAYVQENSGKPLPEKISVYTKLGDKALLRIKSRDYTTQPWQEKALELKLPEGCEEIRLDRNGYVKIK